MSQSSMFALPPIRVWAEFDLHTRKVRRNRKGRITYRGALQHRYTGRNLITNTGMDLLGTGTINAFSAFVQVGTSNTEPAYSDTALGNRVAGVAGSSFGSGTWSWDSVSPKVAVFTRTYTFGTGVAEGVLAELGLSQLISGNLSTHALFKDDEGDPVTVTVLSDEQLIVTYRLYFQVSETDSTLVTTQKEVEYTLTLRPAELGVTLSSIATSSSGSYGNSVRLCGTGPSPSLNQTVCTSYRGGSSAIGSTTQAPTGTSATFNTSTGDSVHTYGAYTPGDHYRDDTYEFILSQNNFTDIGAHRFAGYPFMVQVGSSPRITKTSNDVMRFTIRTAWTRE